MTEPTFDPRFDPAFQRGYEPSTHAQKAPRVPVRAAPADSGGQPPPATEPTSTAEADADTNAEAAQAVAVVTEPSRRRGVNPYVVILWVIGVVFTLGGAALSIAGYVMVLTNFTAGPAQGEVVQALYVYGSAFGIPLFTVGVATVAALIFFAAWRSWRRRNGSTA